MGGEDKGLTLQGLARRLEALKRENAALRHKVATLEGLGSHRGGVAELRGSETHKDGERASEFEGQVSRRALLTKAAAAAVADTAAGTLLNPREARAHIAGEGDFSWDDIRVDSVVAHILVAEPHIIDGFPAVAIRGVSTNDDGITPAVLGTNNASGPGVRGIGGRNGVRGTSSGSDSYGVEGEGDTGVHGHTTKTGYSGVYGLHKGSAGYGLLGDGTGTGAGVLGRNIGGAGVEARDSRYGGKFDGSRAQLLLVPKGTPSKPVGTHAKGEIYMDSAGSLFVCTKSGTPGTWRKVTTTAA